MSGSRGLDVSAFSAGAVARRLGVAVTTLRTWHQRYGLGPSLHEPGHHRRYTEQDIERLETMQRLIAAGVTPGEAARWVTRGLDRAASSPTPSPSESDSATAASEPASDATAAPSDSSAVSFLDSSAASPSSAAADSSASSAGPPSAAASSAATSSAAPSSATASSPAASSAAWTALSDSAAASSAVLAITPSTVQSAVRGVQRAALRLDAPTVRQLAFQVVRRLGVVAAWDEVLRPVLTWIGERHAATGALVEVEHLLSTCFSAVLGAVPRPAPTIPLRVMLACADEEQHSLPIEVLAAALAAAGVPARMLGARVPTATLLAAIRRTGPIALLVWSHHRSTGDPAQLEAIVAEHRRPLVIAAAGPGWDPAELPAEVSYPASLTEAISQLTAYLAYP